EPPVPLRPRCRCCHAGSRLAPPVVGSPPAAASASCYLSFRSDSLVAGLLSRLSARGNRLLRRPCALRRCLSGGHTISQLAAVQRSRQSWLIVKVNRILISGHDGF